MVHATTKASKIPIPKKVKTLNPIKPDSTDKCNGDQFKYCRNCHVHKENFSAMEHNFTTLLKENNYLRQQLAIANQSNTDNYVPLSPSDCDIETVENLHAITVGKDDSTSQPFTLMPSHPFSNFDASLLNQEIEYSHDLSNRQVKFYGDAPYKYSDIVHEPCRIPEDSYILKIIDQVRILFPQYTFNSVLVSKYNDGNSYIPMHSDDEDSITPNSSILTISLGETRKMQFQPKNINDGSEIAISLQHGDVFIMSSVSQQLFKHGIHKDSSKCMRISLTFRDLICTNTDNKTLNSSLDSVGKFLLDLSTSQPSSCPSIPVKTAGFSNNITLQLIKEPSHLLKDIPSTTTKLVSQSQLSVDKVDTIFISSSMFADLNHSKLSSNDHKSAVFYYRGATAGGILQKLQNDPDFNAINAGAVKQIFLLCGTNDVDNIIHVNRNDHSNINIDYSKYDQYNFERTTNDISNLVNYLHSINLNAKVNILNILPRASICRNMVINNLNQYIYNLCSQKRYMSFINTEFRVCLFSSNDGFRKNTYFKQIGSDNVHLNKSGIIRLARHLKYLSHLDCPRSFRAIS